MLVVSCLLLDVSGLLIVGHWLLVIGHWLLVIDCCIVSVVSIILLKFTPGQLLASHILKTLIYFKDDLSYLFVWRGYSMP